jgi:TldD protein
MKHRMRLSAISLLTLGGVLWLEPGSGTRAQQPDSQLLSIMTAELQRNFTLLSKESTPAYFIGYTVYDIHASQIVASFGAVERSEDSRTRSASVDVRVGDYALDNTHPIRGEGGGATGRGGRVAIPLTDDTKPIALALWQATDRAFKG